MKSFLKNFFIYGVSSIVTKMAGFFLIPIYTKLLSPADYGNLFILNSTYLVITLISVGGFENSFARWFFDNEEQLDRNKTTASWFWSQLAINIGVVLLFLFFVKPFISKLTEDLPYPYLTVLLFVFATLFYIIPGVYINYQRVIQKAKRTIYFTIGYSLTTTALSVVFVVIFHLNVFGIALSIFISNFIFSIVGVFLLKEKLKFHFFEKKRALQMFQFSFPFVPAMLSYWLLQSTDSYFIKLITNSSEQIGLFSLGLTVASSIYMFTSAFQQIWPSFIFNEYTKNNAQAFEKTFAFYFELYAVVYLFLQFNLTMFSYNIIQIFSSNPQFYPSYKVVGLISLNTILYSYLSFTAMGMSIKKVSAPLGIALTVSALAGMALNLVFIPKLGFVGSALATILACAPVPVYVFYKSQKLYYLKVPGAKIIGFSLLAFAAVCFFIYKPSFIANNLNDIILKALFTTLVAVIITVFYWKKIKLFAINAGSETGQSDVVVVG
jgi:O-antigen/teichoic acid export membrane protein